ncbi:MAG: tetratricopeptide repeat protein [Deltaproteobacteria bacterium]|nr:tetratricopeptide repeat protein [Deltaproteobacteria bacterium]
MSRALLLVVLSVAASGCFLWTSASQGSELTETNTDHEGRLLSLEDGIADQRQELSDDLNRAKAQVVELEAVLQQATRVVTRNSADIGLRVEGLQEQLSRLEGEIATLRQEIASRDQRIAAQREEIAQQMQKLARRAGVDITLSESDIPADKGEHYSAAYRAYQQNEYGAARALFRAYITRYPEDDQADNALYWVGKSYLRQERPANAIQEFQRVLTTYQRGDAVDETLFDMGNALFALQRCGEARDVLNTLIRNFPRSGLIRRARAKLSEMRSPPPGVCREQ